jgi:hypothetical protein
MQISDVNPTQAVYRLLYYIPLLLISILDLSHLLKKL